MPYPYWSLLDNFERALGDGMPFALALVDRDTFRHALRPDALHLGSIPQASDPPIRARRKNSLS